MGNFYPVEVQILHKVGRQLEFWRNFFYFDQNFPELDQNLASSLRQSTGEKPWLQVAFCRSNIHVLIFDEQVHQDVEMEVESVPAPVEGFSTKNLVNFNIDDIDSEDIDDPQVFQSLHCSHCSNS